MADDIIIRPATQGDLAAIRDIYNDAVRETTAIWNDTLVDLDNRKAWLAARREKTYPVLVAERGGAVVGYCAYADWRAFDGYRQTMEHSVYVEKSARGGGIGRTLMAALIEAARTGGVHVLVGCVEAGNAGSIRLHEALGFRAVGTFREVGQKFGRWLDLTCMELVLDTPMREKA